MLLVAGRGAGLLLLLLSNVEAPFVPWANAQEKGYQPNRGFAESEGTSLGLSAYRVPWRLRSLKQGGPG